MKPLMTQYPGSPSHLGLPYWLGLPDHLKKQPKWQGNTSEGLLAIREGCGDVGTGRIKQEVDNCSLVDDDRSQRLATQHEVSQGSEVKDESRPIDLSVKSLGEKMRMRHRGKWCNGYIIHFIARSRVGN